MDGSLSSPDRAFKPQEAESTLETEQESKQASK